MSDVLKLKSTKDKNAVETEDAFEIDGTMYKIPVRLPASIGPWLLSRIAKVGSETAQAELMVKVLGEDAMDALGNYDELTSEQWDAVVQMVVRKVQGIESYAAKN